MKNGREAVLVTGGAGFIGSHLAEALVQRGAHVTVVDNLASGSLDNLAAIADQIEFVRLDIRRAELAALLKARPFGAIFHFAANAYVPPSVKHPDYDFQTNLRAPFGLLETLRTAGLRPQLIVASSAAVYGNPVRVPIEEVDPTVPISPYGVGKLALERYVAVFSRLYDLPAASLRLFSVFGPRQKKQIVYDFVRKLTATPERLEILGDGTQVRDLVYVGDVVQAALAVYDRAPLSGEVYNVGVGVGHSTAQIGEAVARAMGLDPAFDFTGSIRPGDTDRWVADITRLRALGYAPRFSLEEGVRRILPWAASLTAADSANSNAAPAAPKLKHF